MWDRDAEILSGAAIAERHDRLLRLQVARAYQSAPLFRHLFDKAGVTPSTFGGQRDLTRLPLLSKDDVRAWRDDKGDLFGGAASVPRKDLVVVNHSSGTSGRPTVFGLTEGDLDVVADLFARALYTIGLRAGDRTPVAGTTYWHGYVIGLELGVRLLGARAYRVACGTADCVRTLFERWSDADFTALRCYIPDLEMAFLDSLPASPAELFPNARFVYAGIDISAPKRRMVEAAWGLPFRNTMGSGDQYLVGAECEHSAPYLHVPDDHYVFEVLDPATGAPVAPGGVGELVITNLWAEGCPYIRYRMEDIVTYQTGACPCGRTSMRLRMLGRLAWSVQVADRRVFSSEVEEVVWGIEGLVGAPYQLLRRRDQPQPVLEVRIDAGSRALDAGLVAEALEAAFGCRAKVHAAEPGSIGVVGPNKMERVAILD